MSRSPVPLDRRQLSARVFVGNLVREVVVVYEGGLEVSHRIFVATADDVLSSIVEIELRNLTVSLDREFIIRWQSEVSNSKTIFTDNGETAIRPHSL